MSLVACEERRKAEKQDLSRDSGCDGSPVGEEKWRHNYTIMYGSKQETDNKMATNISE